jgi:hypothetical protein
MCCSGIPQMAPGFFLSVYCSARSATSPKREYFLSAIGVKVEATCPPCAERLTVGSSVVVRLYAELVLTTSPQCTAPGEALHHTKKSIFYAISRCVRYCMAHTKLSRAGVETGASSALDYAPERFVRLSRFSLSLNKTTCAHVAAYCALMRFTQSDNVQPGKIIIFE